MLEREQRDARVVPETNAIETAEIVIALGKRIYRFYKGSPELLEADPATLWQIMYDAYDERDDGKQMLADVEGTWTWTMAASTAKLVHAVYAAGGLEEEPA